MPLTLNPNEFGIGVSMDALTKANGSGLKLRVECSTNHTTKLVAIAGDSTAETLIADGIGHNVPNC